MIILQLLDKPGITWAQQTVAKHHYLHSQVDPRCSVEGYSISVDDGHDRFAGLFLLGRPEATRVNGWYGSVQDVLSGHSPVTRWQVLNLARVWIDPNSQSGGFYHQPGSVPGFIDRNGKFRSTLCSIAINTLSARVGFDYLMRRPPCFLDEPYEIRWLLSYCDTRLHKGTIYQATGFELYRTNKDGIQTWRLPLPPLTPEQDAMVRASSFVNPRSRAYRARRSQLRMEI